MLGTNDLQWIELDNSAFAHNLAVFRAELPATTRTLFVAKANAYGHGLEPMIQMARTEAVEVLGVHSIEEVRAARSWDWTGPIFILGYVARACRKEVLALEAEPTVLDSETLRDYARLGQERGLPVPIHLEIETGTHRQGIDPAELPTLLEEVASTASLRLAGLSTHFANIEDTTDSTYALGQLERFRNATDPWLARFPETIRHTACSAAVLTLPETAFDLVRLGIGAYGYWPSRETRISFREAGRSGTSVEETRLRPVLAWKTRIGQIHHAAAGSYIGYGGTERVTSATRIGMLPIGYSDGFDRGLSRVGHVLVRGQRARVLGRICMNIAMVDLTDIPTAEVEDEVVLLGRQGDEEIRADDLAALLQTISYEVVARLPQSIPRYRI